MSAAKLKEVDDAASAEYEERRTVALESLSQSVDKLVGVVSKLPAAIQQVRMRVEADDRVGAGLERLIEIMETVVSSPPSSSPRSR